MHFDAFPDFSRESVAYLKSSARLPRKDPWGSLYGHMFVEAVRVHIMPNGSESRVEVVPDTPITQRILIWAFASRRYYYRSDLQRTISDFVQKSAAVLANSGIVHYEITRGEWPEEAVALEDINKESTVTVSVQPFRPERIQGHVIRFGRYCLQIVPLIDWPDAESRLAVIPASNVWSLRIPIELGGARRHRRFLKTLVHASIPSPEFVSIAMKNHAEIKDFNFLDFHKQQLLAIASESADWGWQPRDLWQKETLEYFRIYRHLRFALSMAILREHIIDSMNNLLQRVGISARVVLKGLPTKGDIGKYIEEMERGKMTFDDAWEAIQI
jgi:hypothetical protein